MKIRVFLLIFSLTIGSNLFSQNIFSAIRLNTPERILEKKAKNIKYQFWSYGSWGVTKTESEINFNRNNQIIYEKRLKNGQLSQILTFVYNDSSGLLERRDFEQWHRTLGHSKEVNKYEYNSEGHHVGIKTYNQQEQLISQTRIRTNAEGYPIELIIFDSNGNQIGGVEKAQYFPKKNRYVRMVLNTAGMELSRDTSTLHFYKAHLHPNSDQEFDKYGNLIRIGKNGNRYELSEYKYDESGNWIFRKIYEVEILSSKKEKRILKQKYKRKIEYWGF